MKKARISALAAVSAITLAISACGGSSGGATPTSTPNPQAPQVTGTVSATGGRIAFNHPTGLEQFFVNILGKNAYASIEGVIAVGAGVTVNLFEIDASGNPLGNTLATTTTAADGSYILQAPAGFSPGPQFVIRAEGSAGDLDARVIDLATNVDPVSDTTSDIITTNVDDLSLLTAGEVAEISDAVDGLAQNVDLTGVLTSADLNTALVTEATANEELNNIVSSTTSGGQICGNVSDSAGTALVNIRIVVRDFGNWVTRAKTKTDANGDYCVNVPVTGDADAYIANRTLSGNYIIGALNFTGTSMAASQWWNSTSDAADGSGGVNNQFGADMVSVTSTTTITNDFVLDASGSRIQGTVTNSVDGAAVEGMKVTIRNYDTFKSLAAAKVKADGSYRINVKAGDYLLSYRNQTRHPYASEIYRTGTNGVNKRNMASRETMTAGMTHTYDAVLDPGVKIAGTVTDDSAVAQPGQIVSINNNGGPRLDKLRTNKAGKFRIWVKARTDFDPTGNDDVPYVIKTRGQVQNANTNGTDDATPTPATGLVFNAPVTTITGKIVSSATGATPVSRAVVMLKKTPGFAQEDQIASNSDGTFTLYTDEAGDFIVLIRMDNDPTYGSGVFSGTAFDATPWGSATTVTVTAPGMTPATIALNSGANITVPTLGVAPGVGFLIGDVVNGSTSAVICINDTGNCGGGGGSTKGDRLSTISSRGDGSFRISLPANTYNSVRSNGVNCTTLGAIADGVTRNMVLTGAGGTCTVTTTP